LFAGSEATKAMLVDLEFRLVISIEARNDKQVNQGLLLRSAFDVEPWRLLACLAGNLYGG
jgi:hypothetical protein